MPSLRSSVRQRLEAEEAEQQDLVEQADNPIADNPVEAAAQEAIQAKLDQQPSPPALEPKPMQEEEKYEDEVRQLELRAADAQAQVAGHKFGSREYIAVMENRLRPQEEGTPRRERGPVPMAPVSRESPSWSSGRTTPSKTELTGEEVAFCREQNLDLEEYRRNKAKMIRMKAAGVIQE
jgi:hypothetical protein